MRGEPRRASPMHKLILEIQSDDAEFQKFSDIAAERQGGRQRSRLQNQR